jgi:tRNA(fMet)-specific endonuclease VapC
MDPSLLDTDTVSEIAKEKHANVAKHATDYLSQYGQFTISSFTRYELQRGLLERNSAKQLARFATFCQKSVILPITDPVLDRAAELWVTARKGGLPHRDADLIIAATAIENGLVLVTGNTPHFAWIPGLRIENWRKP